MMTNVKKNAHRAMKIIVIISVICACGVMCGCITGPMELKLSKDFTMRHSAASEFRTAVLWAANVTDWRILEIDDFSAVMERNSGYCRIVAELRCNNARFLNVRIKESRGYGASKSSHLISVKANEVVEQLGQLVSDRCNAKEIEIDNGCRRGIDAKGLSSSIYFDSQLRIDALKRLEQVVANEYAGAWAKESAARKKLMDEVELYEKREVAAGEAIIKNGMSNQWHCIQLFLDKLPSKIDSHREEKNTEMFAEIWECFSSSNYVAAAAFGGKECWEHEMRRTKIDGQILRRFVTALCNKNHFLLARRFLDEYKKQKLGDATRIAGELADSIAQKEYESSPHGQRARRVEELAGPRPTMDFISLCEKLEKGDRVGPLETRGLGAYGIVARFDEWSSRERDKCEKEWAKKRRFSDLREIRLNWSRTNNEIRNQIQAHEETEVAKGLRQALAMMKNIQKEESLNYVMMQVGNFEKCRTEVGKDELYEAMLRGISYRYEMIVKSFRQAYSENKYRYVARIFGSEFEMEEDKKAFLKDVANAIVSGLLDVRQYDLLSRMCEDGSFKKYFMLGEGAVASIKRQNPVVTPKTTVALPSVVTGTGWFVNSNHIVTCYHVVKDRDMVSCHLLGDKISLSMVAFDKDSDLAILKVPDGVCSEVYLPLQRKLARLSDKVSTFGYPLPVLLGQDLKYTEGNISSMSGIAGDSRFYQISVPIQPGNSGGALLNDMGEVIGIASSQLDAIKTAVITGDIPQNVNFAIKIRYLIALLDDNSIEFESRDGVGKSYNVQTNVAELATATVLITAE